MNLHDALADAEAASADMARQHADLVAQAEAKQAELDDLDLEIKGLKKAIARHERRLNRVGDGDTHPITGGWRPPTVSTEDIPAPTPTPETTQPQAPAPPMDRQSSATDGHVSGDWQGLHRTEAVARMLAKAEEPVSPSDLSQMLQEVGRDDPPLAVGKALNHLQRKKRASTIERAKWVLVGRDNPVAAPPATGVPQGEEVSSDQEVNGAVPTLTGGEQQS